MRSRMKEDSRENIAQASRHYCLQRSDNLKGLNAQATPMNECKRRRTIENQDRSADFSPNAKRPIERKWLATDGSQGTQGDAGPLNKVSPQLPRGRSHGTGYLKWAMIVSYRWNGQKTMHDGHLQRGQPSSLYKINKQNDARGLWLKRSSEMSHPPLQELEHRGTFARMLFFKRTMTKFHT